MRVVKTLKEKILDQTLTITNKTIYIVSTIAVIILSLVEFIIHIHDIANFRDDILDFLRKQ